MTTDTNPQLSEIERLLVLAASAHGLDSRTPARNANTNRVVWQTVVWLQRDTPGVTRQWRAIESHPAIDEVYDALVRMTHQLHREGPGRRPERPGHAIFEGNGNWGSKDHPPCHPFFNACRLTSYGETIARQLRDHYPEYRDPTEGRRR